MIKRIAFLMTLVLTAVLVNAIPVRLGNWKKIPLVSIVVVCCYKDSVVVKVHSSVKKISTIFKQLLESLIMMYTY